MSILRSLLMLLCVAAVISATGCKSSSTTSPITTSQSYTVDGVNYSNIAVACTGSTTYGMAAVDAGGSQVGIGLGFATKPTAGNYSTILSNPTGTNCILTCQSNTKTYGALTGAGTVVVSVTSGVVGVSFNNITVVNPANPTDTKVISGTFKCTM